MKFKLVNRQFEVLFNWKIAVFYLLLMPVLLALGYWQLHRAELKEQTQNLYQARQAATPTSLAVALAQDDLQYRKVFVNGHYENQHVFLLTL